MAAIPHDVLAEHVWPRLHQLQLRPTLQAVAALGPSSIEDLPDLLCAGSSWHDQSEQPGWSMRVTEALHTKPPAGSG